MMWILRHQRVLISRGYRSVSTNVVASSIDSKHGVGYITLNNPEKRNPLSSEVLLEVGRRIASFQEETSAEVKVIVISASSPTSSSKNKKSGVFSSGHDLKEVASNVGKAEFHAELFDQCSQVMMSVVNSPKPVIAKVNGIATAAGCQLVASCDLAYATVGSQFATPGVNIGLFCSTPAVALARAVGRKHAMEMLLTGKMISAETAIRTGLINRVFENSDDLDRGVDEIARTIASKSQVAVAMGKRTFNKQIEMPLVDAYREASDTMVRNLLTNDAKEGIAAFFEKRAPSWSNS